MGKKVHLQEYLFSTRRSRSDAGSGWRLRSSSWHTWHGQLALSLTQRSGMSPWFRLTQSNVLLIAENLHDSVTKCEIILHSNA